jgi:hypothetical protein
MTERVACAKDVVGFLDVISVQRRALRLLYVAARRGAAVGQSTSPRLCPLPQLTDVNYALTSVVVKAPGSCYPQSWEFIFFSRTIDPVVDNRQLMVGEGVMVAV